MSEREGVQFLHALSPMPMTRYLLTNHVFFCGRGKDLVLLDLHKDAYLLLKDAEASHFKFLTQSATEPQSSPDFHGGGIDVCNNILAELLSARILTTDRSAGRCAAPTHFHVAGESLLDYSTEVLPDIHWRAVWNFFSACTTALMRLRLQKIEDIARVVTTRKLRRMDHGAIDMDRARELVSVFYRLRPLFPANYLCLFDSLALVEFLATYDVFPDWIFAVQFEPWGAHCWVQSGDTAFNEELEIIDRYVPIMVV